MTFMELELKKIVGEKGIFDDVKFIGNNAYGVIGKNKRMKLAFITMGTHKQYEAIRVTVLGKDDGKIDAVVLNLNDLFNKSPLRHPTSLEYMTPYIKIYDGVTYWCGCRPTKADYANLTESIRDYVNLFCDQIMELKNENKPRFMVHTDNSSYNMGDEFEHNIESTDTSIQSDTAIEELEGDQTIMTNRETKLQELAEMSVEKVARRNISYSNSDGYTTSLCSDGIVFVEAWAKLFVKGVPQKNVLPSKDPLKDAIAHEIEWLQKESTEITELEELEENQTGMTYGGITM